MAPKFGTSGLRGLVSELTDMLIDDYARSFLAACDTGAALYLGRDLRDSSLHLANVIVDTARMAGVPVVDCGALPTPALALAALEARAGAIMVTGSHIPADRNGLKFYSIQGEITKTDEAAILGRLGQPVLGAAPALLRHDDDAAVRFHTRFLAAFGPVALKGARIGVWSHSSVGRDLLITLLNDLGATVTELGRSESFVSVDTEAVDAPTRAQLRHWATSGLFDAIASTDGDADRPLFTDATGEIVPGDVLGQITAQFLGADVVVTPVSSNGGVDLGGYFEVVRTKIGSPYVIDAIAAQTGRRVVGYEANGGFIQGFDTTGPCGPLPSLPTRDCILPILATLVASRNGQCFDVAACVAREPARFTATNRIEDVPVAVSTKFLATLLANAEARAQMLADLGLSHTHEIETTDGLRMTEASGTVLHLRPSGNAPEFRVYIETDNRALADALLPQALLQIGDILTAAIEEM